MPTPAQTQTTGPNRDISTSRTKKYKRCLSPKEFDQTTTTVKFTKRRVVASFPCDKRCLIYIYIYLIIALCSPTQNFSSICRHYNGTTHGLHQPLSLDTIISGCGDHYWHVDKWPGNELSLRPVLECETVPEICCLWGSNSRHIHAVIGLLLLILEDNKASCMRFIGRWNLCLHSTSCPLDHWSNPGVLIILIGS